MSATKKLPADLPPLPPVPKGFDAWEYMGEGYVSEAAEVIGYAGTRGIRWEVDFNETACGDECPSLRYIRAIKRPAKRKQPKQHNADKIARALRMVAESRPRMAKLTREQRQELEASARATMAKGKKRVCKCNMRTKLVGDGCAMCNPELWADLIAEEGPKKPKQAKAVKAVTLYAPKNLGHSPMAGGYFISSYGGKDKTPVFILPADKASVERMREQAMRAIINDPMATLGDTITAVFASIGITSTKGRQ